MIITGTRVRGGRYYGGTGSASDAYFDLVALLLPGNGTNGSQNNTFQDSSSNALTVTRSGNPTQGTFSPFSQTGWSNYFDGTGDYLSTTATAVGTNSFTVEAWVYLTAGSAYMGIYSSTEDTSGVGINLGIDNTNNVQGFVGRGNSGTFLNGTTPLSLNTWHHVAFVRNGSALSLYVNGTSVDSDTSSTSITATSAVIGRFYISYNGFYMNGYISNVRLVNGTAVYTSNFAVPTTPLTAITNTQLLTCQSSRFIDNSTSALAITVVGNTSVQAFAPFNPTAAYSTTTVGGSAYLDGSGDYLTISNPASLLTFGTGDFTIECFVYPTAASSSSYVCWIYGNTTVINAIIINSNTGAVTFRLRGTNLSETDVTSSSGLLRVGEWTHLALVRTGTNFYGYVNGTRFSTTIAANAAFNEAQAQFFTQPQIGASSNPVGNYFTGYVSGWRALKGTALYTAATITVPSAPLTAVANTSALLNSTNGGITDATAKNVIETVGSAQISTAQSKFGGSSMLFDGSGDYLVSPASVNYEVGTGSYTIEFWIYWNVIGNIAMLFGWNGGATGSTFGYTYSDGRIGVGINGTNEIVSSSGQATTGSWIHMAFVKNGSTTTIYKNGVAIASSTTGVWSSNTGTATFSVGGGASASDTNCYIDDLRITKGLARYTANFTPPTAAFPLL